MEARALYRARRTEGANCRLSPALTVLAAILLGVGCGGGQREKTYTGLTVPVFSLPEEKVDLLNGLKRDLRELGEDYVCVIVPSRDSPLLVYVRRGSEPHQAAQRVIERLRGSSLTAIRTTTRFDSAAGRERLKQRLRATAPDGVDVNQEDSRRPECPRLVLQIPPGGEASEEAVAWAEDIVDEYGSDSVFIERSRFVDE